MRDRARIMPLCTEVAIKWQKKCPDWRFTQLMINFLSWAQGNGYGDCFYMEDDEFLEVFNRFMREVH